MKAQSMAAWRNQWRWQINGIGGWRQRNSQPAHRSMKAAAAWLGVCRGVKKENGEMWHGSMAAQRKLSRKQWRRNGEGESG
jgi:hypothetical protein